MLDALTITEAEAAGLSELAALDLVMARDFAAGGIRGREHQSPYRIIQRRRRYASVDIRRDHRDSADCCARPFEGDWPRGANSAPIGQRRNQR